MLIQKTHSIGDVVSMKLSTGEEIIGRLEEESETGLDSLHFQSKLISHLQ